MKQRFEQKLTSLTLEYHLDGEMLEQQTPNYGKVEKYEKHKGVRKRLMSYCISLDIYPTTINRQFSRHLLKKLLLNCLQSLEKKSGQRVFCRYNKKVSAKDFLEADVINTKKSVLSGIAPMFNSLSINFVRASLFNDCPDFNSDDCISFSFSSQRTFAQGKKPTITVTCCLSASL